jgi:hypothetical protein
LPHVVGITYGVRMDHTRVIYVEVDKPENVNEVEHKIPPLIDGFPVDVFPVPHDADDGTD